MRNDRRPARAAVFLACAAACSLVRAAPAGDPTLRELMDARGLMIGSAVDADALRNEPEYGQVLSAQFNILTPENAMKFGQLHPRPGVGPESYDFAKADEIVAFARAHGMRVRGHTLVWHREIPAWLNKVRQPEVLREILRDHIQSVVGHFKGQVYCWDVVNEAIGSDGSLRKTLWSPLGPGYVADAFRWAHDADPGAKLFYNDYDADVSPRKADAIYRLVKGLKDDGVPIDGVGFQLHLVAGPRAGNVYALLHRFAGLGVEVHVTELDVSPIDLITVIRSALGEDSPRAERRRQGEVYARALQSCLAEPACKAFVMWGFTDKHTWLPIFRPTIFDSLYRPKPAFDALMSVLRPSVAP